MANQDYYNNHHAQGQCQQYPQQPVNAYQGDGNKGGPQGGYYPQQPMYGGGGYPQGYQGQPQPYYGQPQQVYVQQPQQQSSSSMGCCLPCMAGMAACCCLEMLF
ncbi:hypothetical protein T439DRAFT_320587 [Meredithblackwellia eburnea MCA 4105]